MVLKICTPEARDVVRLYEVRFRNIFYVGERERARDSSSQHKKNPRPEAAGFLVSLLKFWLFQPTCNHPLHFLFFLLS
jgi:hypothetical protein